MGNVSTPAQLSKWHAVRTGRIQHFDTMQTLPYVQTLHSACCGESANVLTCAGLTERTLCVQNLGGIPECSTLRRRARACNCVTMRNTQSCLPLPHPPYQPTVLVTVPFALLRHIYFCRMLELHDQQVANRSVTQHQAGSQPAGIRRNSQKMMNP